jgi:hypothetical protein
MIGRMTLCLRYTSAVVAFLKASSTVALRGEPFGCSALDSNGLAGEVVYN